MATETVTFDRADPRTDPASSLLVAMSTEMTELYGQPDRLDHPALQPANLLPPDGSYLVGWSDGQPVAGGGVRRLSDALGEIKRMYVEPGHRSRGVARALLAALEDEARSLGYDRVRLDTGPLQPHAMALYTRSGYEAVERYNDNPYAVFWGEKRLGPD
jgi:GNAT superfamily N-acetyltransferase